MIFGIGKASSIKRGSAEHRFTDGYASTAWQSNVESGSNTTTFQTELEYPADVTSLQLYGYYEESETPETDSYSVLYQVKNGSGDVLAEGTVNGLTNGEGEDAMRAVSFDTVLSGATTIVFTIDTSESANGHACTGRYYGMREVFVYGLPPAAPDLSERGIEKIAVGSASATSENAQNGASLALDDDEGTAWQSATRPGDGANWGTQSLTLNLDAEKIVTAITLKGYDATENSRFAVAYELLNDRDERLASGTKYNVTGAGEEQVIGLNYGVSGVKKIVLTMDPTNGGTVTPDEASGWFGLRSVALQGTPVPQDRAALQHEKVEVSSQTGGYEADKAFDGSEDTAWRCNNVSGSTWDARPTMTIQLQETSRVDALQFSFYEESPETGISRHVSCMLYDTAGRLVYSGGLMADNAGHSAFDFGIGATDVKQIKLLINPSGITNGSDKLGFREIRILGAAMDSSESKPLGDISPELGASLEDTVSGETGTWRYFDDRVFNRNQDDYNDLMGFFDVKRGEETLGNYVAAGVYVYSDQAREVQWQFAGSGLYKLFCNDRLVGEQANVPGDVQKDGTKYPVALQEGWNKLLVQIQHVNPNAQCNLMGFYSRLCDMDGNIVEGLTCSVSGPHTGSGALEIVTQGLEIDRESFERRNADCTANEYPENTLPYAYEKNPYVGLVSVSTAGYAGQASLFAFQAAGGKPRYTWELVKGTLPGGLALHKDGTISGTVEAGAAENSTKDYAFTLRVTDSDGLTAEKDFVMTAKLNPAQWFEEGRMSALSHCTGTIPNLYDPNYNYDEWAQTAKAMGMTMLSTESYQNSLYYWPSPNANLTPDDSNPQYKYGTMYQDEFGEWHIIDRVMQAKEAAERYGLHFGTYLSPQRPQTDIQGLVERYDPWYIFVDGNPQGGVNLDIAFSSARNYNDRVLFNTNPSREVSDQDLTLMERPFWYSQPYTEGGTWENNIQPGGKYFVHEEWNDPYSTALDLWRVWAPGGDQMRDSWPDAAKELIDAIGHGYVMNHDLSIAASRGLDNLNWGGAIRTSMDKDNIYMMVPIDSQQMSDMRLSMAAWLANGEKPDLYESLFGTMPYYIEYTPQAGWHEPGTQLAFFYGEGPEWGYSLYRDQYVYLHMIENLIGKGRDKKGFTGQKVLENIGPFDYEVEKVSWLNEGQALEFTQSQKDGKYYIEIDTSPVTADPIDTILKIETADPTRNYRMTDIHVFSSQTEGGTLNLRTECYMNHYTSVFAPADVTYASKDTKVATVEANGTVRAVGDGRTEILVTSVYDDGVNEKQIIVESYPVKVSGGKVFPDLPLTGVGLFTNGNAFWEEVFAGTSAPVELKGYTEYGGTVDLLDGVNVEEITYHYAKVDGSTHNPTGRITVSEVAQEEVPFALRNGRLILDAETGADKYYCYWADVTVDGRTFTTSRNYITLMPDHNIAEGMEPDVTSGDASALTDGVINDATGGNLTRWSTDASDGDPRITFDFGRVENLTRVNLFFNRMTADANSVTYANAPKQISIEYSMDGVEWITGNTISKLTGDTLPTVDSYDQLPTSGATSYAWEAENLFYNYPIDTGKSSVPARYVRITFPGGGQNNETIELLEARVFATGSQKYAVLTDGALEHGAITTDKQYAAEGEQVKVSVSPSDGYRLTEGSLQVNGGAVELKAVAGETGVYTFVMPGSDVSITATFELVSVTVDKSQLREKYNAYKNTANDGYTEESWSAFQSALTDAKKVLDNTEASEEDVRNATTVLETAYRALEKETSQPGSDKSALEALYGLYRNTANDGYTEESWQAFQAALEGAKKILEGEAAS